MGLHCNGCDGYDCGADDRECRGLAVDDAGRTEILAMKEIVLDALAKDLTAEGYVAATRCLRLLVEQALRER